MKISIITAVRNNKDQILQCLESVANQSHVTLEHIVQDSHSTDGTTQIIKNFENESLKLFIEKDSGIYDALNKAMDKTSGDVIGLLHSDDLFENQNVLKAVKDEFDKGVDVVYGDLNYVSKEDTSKIFREWKSGEFTPSILKNGWMPPHPSFFFKRELLEKIGNYNTNYKIAADYDFMLKILTLKNIQVSYIPKTLVKMRVGGTSNRSLKNIMIKTNEDYKTMKKFFPFPLYSVVMKNLRKLNQIKISYFKKS